MKGRITLTIDDETANLLKTEAARRKVSVKKLGEEYFYKMVAILELENKTKNYISPIDNAGNHW